MTLRLLPLSCISNCAFLLSKSNSAFDKDSLGTVNSNRTYGSNRIDDVFISACRTAREAACLKSPPSVCFK